MTRIGADRLQIVSTIARSIAARWRVWRHCPRLVRAANRAGVRIESTLSKIFNLFIAFQYLVNDSAEQLTCRPVVVEFGSMPDLGAVAEVARTAPLRECQPHGPRLAVEN